MTTASGACLCGAVRFTAALPSLWVAHCHCTLCRRAHGAGFVTWAGFAGSAVQIDDGEGQLHWFDSSPGAQRGFCARCGSPLFFRSARWPGELHIARAHFEAAIDRTPEVHVFWDSHVDWALPAEDGLPRKGTVG